jgi:hypothetical protein
MTKGPAIQLFNFAQAINISQRSIPNGLYDVLMDLIPDIDVGR